MGTANKKMQGAEARYCREICGGQCCYLRTPEEGVLPCPNLKEDKSCGVYEKRYADGMPNLVQVGTYRSRSIVDLEGQPAVRPFFCGRIVAILAAKGLPPEVEAQCCVAHPELLKGVE
jgi:hypothetical protein